MGQVGLQALAACT